MPAEPISRWILNDGARPTEGQLSEVISSFRTDHNTFISLAMRNMMISLAEVNMSIYKYLQRFFINDLIQKDLRDRVQRRRHNPEFRGYRVPNFQVRSTSSEFIQLP